MGELTKDAIHEIEQIHSRWIAYELAGEDQNLLALCADDIELWPPDSKPLSGRSAVSRQMAQPSRKVLSIEISNRRIRGSNDIAYLTADFKITFPLQLNSTPELILGSHLWILRKNSGPWLIHLVTWSLWNHDAVPAG
jgi:ketosteroid isomerase-like protein